MRGLRFAVGVVDVLAGREQLLLRRGRRYPYVARDRVNRCDRLDELAEDLRRFDVR